MRSPFVIAFLTTLFLYQAAAQSPQQSLSTTAEGQPQMTGGDYTLDATFDPTGQAVGQSASAVIKLGYAGQITDPRSLKVTASDVAEGGTTSPTATATLDDGTTEEIPTSELSWDLLSGPLSSISLAGVVSATTVFQDTQASVRGSWFGVSDTGEFTVLNHNNDDLGPVAGDGIDDSWQMLYFDGNGDGQLDTAEADDAQASADPDGDQQNNHFEFLADYAPDDGASLLGFQIVSIVDETVTIELSKVVAGTRYTLIGSSDLNTGDPWSEVAAPISGLDQFNFRFQHQGVTRHFYKLVLTPAP